eukprot:1011732-Pelagomonas_calceolata.AAC.5
MASKVMVAATSAMASWDSLWSMMWLPHACRQNLKCGEMWCCGDGDMVMRRCSDGDGAITDTAGVSAQNRSQCAAPPEGDSNGSPGGGSQNGRHVGLQRRFKSPDSQKFKPGAPPHTQDTVVMSRDRRIALYEPNR